MSLIVFGLQYDPSMNFHEFIARNVSLERPERECLHSELKARYRDWIADDPDALETRLSTHLKNVPKSLSYGVLVVPSCNDRFKNVYLIGHLPQIRSDDRGETAGKYNSMELERLVSRILARSPGAVRLAKSRLARIVENDIDQLPLLLLFGAVLYAELVDCEGDSHRPSLGDPQNEQPFEVTTKRERCRGPGEASMARRILSRIFGE